MKSIERFFLNTLLRVSILGVLLILASNVFLYPEDTLSIVVSSVILAALVASYLLRSTYPSVAVLITTGVATAAMVYQRLASPETTTTLAIMLIIGFIASVMLKGIARLIMHGIIVVALNTVFTYKVEGAVVAAITYTTLYVILAYATAVLKYNYDKIHRYLKDSNAALNGKAAEFREQNEELRRVQDELSSLNGHLEQVVNERTAKVKHQNEVLLKYSYTNAHHLRGPVARLLGLAQIYQLEESPDADFYIKSMVDQAHEIDTVVNQINTDLESNPGGEGIGIGYKV
jgi:signal transduction histidine kinase